MLPGARHWHLTEHQRIICELLMNGYQNQAIAASSGFSRQSVKVGLYQLYQRFEVPLELNQRIVFALYLHAHRKKFGLICQACQ